MIPSSCHQSQVVSHLSSAASHFVALELHGSVVRVAKPRGEEKKRVAEDRWFTWGLFENRGYTHLNDFHRKMNLTILNIFVIYPLFSNGYTASLKGT